MEFTPVESRKWGAGWSAEKQGHFLRHLAATASVTQSAAHVGMSVRSAYYLRTRADAESFRDAWDRALRISAGQLLGVAYDRALNGARRQYFKDGELVGETVMPSDRVLLWLLGRVDPHHVPFEANPYEKRTTPPEALLKTMAKLRDVAPSDQDIAEHTAGSCRTEIATLAAHTGFEPVE
ncbi:MAG: hypothetical protein ACRC1J_06155 [Sandaracinobacteroides sp.]